ncbi:ABC transporter ATP-binding protein [Streptomyces sp. NPDC059866]|uniref:ABC transporter ATP-binding protein n=1 Tax=Streptomyces sp. NPDC059866 TaxID=3346978 RepID=UPI00365CF661
MTDPNVTGRGCSAAGPGVIETSGLAAGHAGLPVVRNLDLRVRRGEIVALLGPNGAGKTTTLMTLAGLLPPIRGQVRVLGCAPGRHPHRLARRGVALVPEDRGLFPGLTVAEHLRLARGREAANRAGGRRRVVAVVDEHFPELRRLMNQPCGLLSGGEQQMLAVCRALATDPVLLMVDEMSLGLAPKVAHRLLSVLRRVAVEREMAVLLVEQHVHLALEVADRGYVLSHGEVVMQGQASYLRDNRGLLASAYLGGTALT